MGFEVKNKETNERYGIVKFIFTEPFNTEDMKKVLEILTSLLDLKKPFAFYVDTRNANRPPLNAASILLHWLKANKLRFKKQLICSAVVFGNTMSNNLVSKLLKTVFVIHPPVSPNLLSSDMDVSEKWINEKIKDFFEK